MVTAVEVLFVALGSLVVAETIAVFVSVVAWAGAVTRTVMVGAVPPVTRAGRVHDTDTLPVLVQAQPVPTADTNVTPAGSASLTRRPAASDGPRLETTSE